MKPKFTIKLQRFIDFYDGNATEAARKAGYKGNDNTLKQVGSENLAKPYISSAIKNREEKRSKSTIMSREERQEFWTKMALNSKKKDSDRLKASELLGRSEADFTDKTTSELIIKHDISPALQSVLEKVYSK